MRATDTFTVETRSVFIALSDAEPRRVPYTSRKRYRPERLQLGFRRENNKPWKLMSIELSGPSVRANGLTGTDRGTERFLFDMDDIPDEITALIDTHRPKEN